MTKNSAIHDWRLRNEDYLQTLRASGNRRAWLVSAADKVSNLTDILEDYAEVNERLWGRFNAGKDGQLWWYGAVADELAELLPGHVLTQRLASLLAQLNVAVSDAGTSDLTCRALKPPARKG